MKISAVELNKKLKAKEVSARDIVDSVYQQIDKVESKIQAYVCLTKDIALKQAAIVDGKIARGEAIGPLAGIPIAIKDNMNLIGTETTCCSKILKGYISPYNATVIDKVLAEGMLPIGKTNLDEFAMGSSTENSAFGPTRNPWNTDCVPGGSSGGSAAAVAAGTAVLSLGSDTGGSIRQPASFCGVVGMKPTYGRVSRYGLVAFASSLDQIGPFSRNVMDSALLLNLICGRDEHDSTSVDMPVPDFTSGINGGIKGLKVGIIKELMGEGNEPAVQSAMEASIKTLESLGAVCEEVSVPSSMYSIAAYYIIAPAEASANLARFDGVRYGHRDKTAGNILDMYEKTRDQGFGPEVKRRIIIGTYVLSSGYYDAYYSKAQKVRTLITSEFKKLFEKYDVLITPTSPTVAFKFGEKAADPLKMYLSDIATVPVNLAGLPGISLPCGFDRGLPIGLQIIGRHFDESTVLRCAYAFEQAAGWNEQRLR